MTTGLKILSNPDNTVTEPSFFDVQPLMHVPRQESVENLLEFQLEVVRQLVGNPLTSSAGFSPAGVFFPPRWMRLSQQETSQQTHREHRNPGAPVSVLYQAPLRSKPSYTVNILKAQQGC